MVVVAVITVLMTIILVIKDKESINSTRSNIFHFPANVGLHDVVTDKQ